MIFFQRINQSEHNLRLNILLALKPVSKMLAKPQKNTIQKNNEACRVLILQASYGLGDKT